jgi:hypothetical protein
VLRRSLTVLLAVGLTAVAAGCTTFSDNDAVARVGDTELSRDTFETQLTDLGVNPADVLSADAVRSEITNWILEQLAALPVDEEALAADYDAGLATSGALCLSAIVVDDEATATDLAAELDGGAAFADLFAAENLDQQLATTNGALPCLTAADIDTAEGVPFIDVAVGLDAAERFGSAPLVDDAGTEVAWVVLAFRPFAELTEDDIALISTGRVTADVHVDPRYGTFDQSTTQVVPLG